MNPSGCRKFRWKGKIVTEKVYNHRVAVSSIGKNNKNHVVVSDKKDDSNSIVEGRRIVDIRTLANCLSCSGCNDILSLKDIEKEECRGLASIFDIRCRTCLLVNRVPTSACVLKNDRKRMKIYDVNSKAVLGKLSFTLNVL